MLLIVVAVLGFAAVAGVGLVFAGGGPSARMVKRTQSITAAPQRTDRTARGRAAPIDAGQRRKQILKSLKEQERIQRQASVTLAARLQQAGLNATVPQFWIVSGVIGAVALAATLLLRANILICAGATFAAAFGLPRWIVGFLAKRRTAKFTAAFADAIDIVVRGIRSGLPVGDCLKIIARESPQPLSAEFSRLVENLAMGLTMEQGLEKMYERMPTSELRFFTIVLAIQSKTGGNLAEALANLSTVLRARKLMREKIKALSSEATASAFIIGSLPPSVMLLITVTTPSYMKLMFTDNRGQLMLLGGAIWMSMGIFVMRRMINFKF
ncbi:MAG: type II secretion system F family protein [Caulobacteraceae bacterium]|nr:type II secretion system F family protein [Caulobacteraceae bacterium]